MRLHLFRLKVYLPAQKEAFVGEMSPSAVLERALEERPTATLRKGQV